LEDIKLLETTDALHRRLNSAATKEILRREAKLFGHNDYNRISKISTSHINNLRHSNTYHKVLGLMALKRGSTYWQN